MSAFRHGVWVNEHMKKILVLANNDVGLYRFRREVLEAMISQGWEVMVSLPYGELIPEIEKTGCRFIRTEFARRGMNPFKDIELLLRYMRIIREEKPDMVLTYTIKPNVYGGVACGLMKTPYISNVTGLGTSIENPGILQMITLTLYRLGLMRAKCVFFQNESNLAFFKAKRILTGRSQTIPGSGVNTAENCYEAYPSEHDGIRFLFVGRMMKDKGIDELLDAAKELRKRHKKCTFTLIGDCDEDYHARLKELDDQGIVRYLGFRKNIHEHIGNHHCMVLPSYHEGMANVLLEAAASGRPVIATDVPGCRETFDEGVSGIGCRARSAEDLVRALEEFLAMPEETHRQMGIAGRKKIEQEYDRRIVIRKYIDEIIRREEHEPV